MKTFDFKNRKQILNLIESADDKIETQYLLNQFETLKRKRKPFYLDMDDFEKVLKWKLRTQYWRQVKLRTLNTSAIIKKVTALVFEIKHENENYEIELKLKLLTCLAGVGIPIASAILTLTNPDNYAVIDFRAWRQIFDSNKTNYTIKDYLKYLKELKQLSKKYNLNLQKIDIAI